MDNRAELDLGYAIHDVARLLRRAFDERVRKYELTRAQWRVLAHLYRCDGQTQAELASQLDMEPAPVGRMLDKLEKQGWIIRRNDENDRRARRVLMTKKIRPHVSELRQEAIELYAVAVASCGEKQVRAFFSVLEKMKENLTRDLDHKNVSNLPPC